MEKDILQNTKHRKHPLPQTPWMMMQKWEQLLFLHWSVSPQLIKEYIPTGLELDTYEEQAWLTVAAFKVSKIHFRFMPSIPHLQSPLQLNIRTYVKKKGRKGVYFLTIDVNKLYLFLGGRLATLPFIHSKMSMKKHNNLFSFSTFHSNQHQFHVTYEPKRSTYFAESNDLSEWLLERYVLWTSTKYSLYQGEIHHKPWEIQEVNIDIEDESILPYIPKESITQPPIAHFVESKVALIWMLQKIDESS